MILGEKWLNPAVGKLFQVAQRHIIPRLVEFCFVYTLTLKLEMLITTIREKVAINGGLFYDKTFSEELDWEVKVLQG
ncbi:hypothetical protein CJO79_18565 (plasmid) [Ralstonia solanacearum]|nr:hypothetical protein CJO76_18580 [Ralstonia solanacearum]AXV93014.1 hypothetical protein CJO79_18565 [Ralstonia solanacearum]AXW21075.1 hypothetical protein CJO85_18630 [Ralstonia solanacearum]AXW77912.1 hypothetical protein CJO97_18560 [Ralstonia solanacearum]